MLEAKDSLSVILNGEPLAIIEINTIDEFRRIDERFNLILSKIPESKVGWVEYNMAIATIFFPNVIERFKAVKDGGQFNLNIRVQFDKKCFNPSKVGHKRTKDKLKISILETITKITGKIGNYCNGVRDYNTFADILKNNSTLVESLGGIHRQVDSSNTYWEAKER